MPKNAETLLPGPWWFGEPDPGTGRIMIISRPSATGVGIAFRQQEAALFAASPAMYRALAQLVAEFRESGYFEQQDYHPIVGCGCGACLAVRALALVEGGGRCLLCGCSQDDACENGCAWADTGHLVCNAHPSKMIRAALRHAKKEGFGV